MRNINFDPAAAERVREALHYVTGHGAESPEPQLVRKEGVSLSEDAEPAREALIAAERALAAHDKTVPAADAIETWAAERVRLLSLVEAHKRRAEQESAQLAQVRAGELAQAQDNALNDLMQAYDRRFSVAQAAKQAIEDADSALETALEQETRKVAVADVAISELEARAIALGVRSLPARPEQLVAAIRTAGRGIWL